MSLKLLFLFSFSIHIHLSITSSRENRTPTLAAGSGYKKLGKNDKNTQPLTKSENYEKPIPFKTTDPPTSITTNHRHKTSLNEKLFGLVTCTSKSEFAKNNRLLSSEEYKDRKKSTGTGTGTGIGAVTQSNTRNRKKSDTTLRELIHTEVQSNKDTLIGRRRVGKNFKIDVGNPNLEEKGKKSNNSPSPSLTSILKRTLSKTSPFGKISNEKGGNARIHKEGQNEKGNEKGKDKVVDCIRSSKDEFPNTKTEVRTAESVPSSSKSKSNDQVTKSFESKQLSNANENSWKKKHRPTMTMDSWVDVSSPISRRNSVGSDTRSEGSDFSLDGEISRHSFHCPGSSNFTSVRSDGTPNYFIETSNCDQRSESNIRLLDHLELFLTQLAVRGSLLSKEFKASRRTRQMFGMRPISVSKAKLSLTDKDRIKKETVRLEIICREIIDNFDFEIPDDSNFKFSNYQAKLVENVKIGNEINQKAVLLGDCLLKYETLSIILGRRFSDNTGMKIRYYFVATRERDTENYVVRDYFKKSLSNAKKGEYSHASKFPMFPAVCE